VCAKIKKKQFWSQKVKFIATSRLPTEFGQLTAPVLDYIRVAYGTLRSVRFTLSGPTFKARLIWSVALSSGWPSLWVSYFASMQRIFPHFL